MKIKLSRIIIRAFKQVYQAEFINKQFEMNCCINFKAYN